MNNGAGKRIMARKKEIVWLWNNGVSSSEMAYKFGCNNSTINSYAKKMGLERRWLKSDFSKSFEDLTQDQIKERCKEVRETWDAATEWNRRVQKTRPLTVRHMLWTEHGFADNGEMEAEEVIAVEKFKKSLDAAGHQRSAYNVFN